jgi:nucleoside-triphosphatase
MAALQVAACPCAFRTLIAMRHIFLTGKPGVGKTTIIRKVLERLKVETAGFFTREIRRGGERVGFELVTLSGKKAILAHKQARSPFRVGKYRVNVEAFEQIALPELERASRQASLVVIDELGRMELFSEKFQRCVQRTLDRAQLVLGVVQRRANPFTDAVKSRSDVLVIEVTETNRDRLPEEIIRRIKETMRSA